MHFSMSKLIITNYKTTMKYIILIVALLAFCGWYSMQTAKVEKIQYCWDSNGAHYVAPDARCSH